MSGESFEQWLAGVFGALAGWLRSGWTTESACCDFGFPLWRWTIVRAFRNVYTLVYGQLGRDRKKSIHVQFRPGMFSQV